METRFTVQQKFIINGQTYDSLESMPPDARQVAEDALQKARTDPTVKQSGIKFSFHVDGPGHPMDRLPGYSASTPGPIEPSSTEGGVRVALLLGGCAIVGLALWWFSSLR